MAGNASRINGKKGGRPQGYETSETKMRRAMKRRWLECVSNKADAIFDAHLDLALGHHTETQTTMGTVRIYQRPPDARSLHWIMEQVWGKVDNFNSLGDTKTESTEEILDAEGLRLLEQAIDFAMPKRRQEQSSAPQSQ